MADEGVEQRTANTVQAGEIKDAGSFQFRAAAEGASTDWYHAGCPLGPCGDEVSDEARGFLDRPWLLPCRWRRWNNLTVVGGRSTI